METSKAKNGTIALRGIIGGVIAAVLNLIVFFISKAMNVSMLLPGDPNMEEAMELNPMAVSFFSLLPAIVAFLILMLLNRFAKKPFMIFMVISIVILLVSFFPLTMAETAGTIIMLSLMHIIAAVAIVGALKTAYKA